MHTIHRLIEQVSAVGEQEGYEMGHSFNINWHEIEKWLLAKERIKSPASIVYSCDRPCSAYWARIKKLEDENKRAAIKITVAGQTISIVSDNISDYALNLKECPIDLSKAISIVENNKEIFSGQVTEMIFNNMLWIGFIILKYFR